VWKNAVTGLQEGEKRQIKTRKKMTSNKLHFMNKKYGQLDRGIRKRRADK
jgi:hypothetical protein